jgi:hypothetical protein
MNEQRGNAMGHLAFANDGSARAISLRSISAVALLHLPLVAGCIDMAQEEYNRALQQVNLEQERLDGLRPAYDAARQTAMQTVYKEITGSTPEDSAAATLSQIESIAAGAGAQPTGEAKGDDIDRAIDQLTKMQEVIEKSQGALSGGIGGTNEVMTKIKTPGTPEFKRFEEVLAAMPEVQTYERQKKRLENASKAALEAEAKLPDAAKKP